MRSPSYFKGQVKYYAEFTARCVEALEADVRKLRLRPIGIARVDELPQADVSDLVRAYHNQRTIDENSGS